MNVQTANEIFSYLRQKKVANQNQTDVERSVLTVIYIHSKCVNGQKEKQLNFAE